MSIRPFCALMLSACLAALAQAAARDDAQVQIDVTAQDQFFKVQPIVRRVQLGRYHVVATCDPQWQKNQVTQSVELKGFDGRKGLTVLLPADSQTRIFVMRQPE
jgi:hypothetical protein